MSQERERKRDAERLQIKHMNNWVSMQCYVINGMEEKLDYMRVWKQEK